MKYISAQWVKSEVPGMPDIIKAIGDDDMEYWVPAWNTDVPPWPEYIMGGGSIQPAEEVEPVDGS